MFATRHLFLITILTCLAFSCASRGISPTPSPEIPGTTTPIIRQTQADQESEVATVCFTPREMLPFAFVSDSTGLALRASHGVQIIDLQTGEELAFLRSSKMIFTAALSPDGTTLAWSLEDGSIQLIRITDQEVLHTLSAHPDTVLDLNFFPTGNKLLSVSHDGWVRVWDTRLGSLLPSIQAGREILGIGIAPDGTRVATIPGDGPVQLWDLANVQLIKELGGTGGYDTSEAGFSPDGQYLIADLATGIFLWNVSDSKLVWDEVKNSMAVAYSPDGRFLAYTDIDDNNKVFLATTDGAKVIQVIEGMQGPVWELFFSPDSSLLTATDGIDIRVWGVENGELLFIGKPTCP